MRNAVLLSVAIVLVIAMGVTASAETNVLLGQWHLTQQVLDPNYQANVCTRTDLLFTPDRFGVAIGGKWTGYPVSGYDASDPSHIFVQMESDEAFTVVDQNTIAGIEGPTKCIYTRNN